VTTHVKNHPEPIVIVDDPDYPANPKNAPEPHYIVDGIPSFALPAATPTEGGVAKQAAKVDPASGTFAADLITSLVNAGLMAAA